MKYPLSFSVVGVAALASAVVFAFPSNFAGDGARKSRTAVSGHTGLEKRVGDPASDQAPGFLWKIEWSETSDHPCYFGAYTAKIANGSWVVPSAPQVYNDICQKRAASLKTVMLQMPSGESARFIRSVQVCLSERKNSADERMKGIRVKSARLDADGRFVSDNATESAVRTHCKQWAPEVSCPEGQAATAMHLQVGGGGTGAGSSSIRGIALECAPPRTTTARPPARRPR